MTNDTIVSSVQDRPSGWPSLAMTMLLVEHSRETAQQIRCIVPDGVRVEWRPNLVSAMVRIAAGGIDVVLLNPDQPETRGHLSLVAIEIATKGQIPIIVVTDNSDQKQRDLMFAHHPRRRNSRLSAYILRANCTREILYGEIARALRGRTRFAVG